MIKIESDFLLSLKAKYGVKILNPFLVPEHKTRELAAKFLFLLELKLSKFSPRYINLIFSIAQAS